MQRWQHGLHARGDDAVEPVVASIVSADGGSDVVSQGEADGPGGSSRAASASAGTARVVQDVDARLKEVYDELPEHAMLVVLAQGSVAGLVDARGHVKRRDQQERDALAAEAQLGVMYVGVKNASDASES